MKNLVKYFWLIALVAIFFSKTLFAQCYTLYHSNVNAVWHWTNHSVTYYVNVNGSRSFSSPHTTEANAVDAAFTTWQNVVPASIVFNDGNFDAAAFGNDGKSVLYWSNDPNLSPYVVASLTPWGNTTTGVLTNVDIWFNDYYYQWTNGTLDFDSNIMDIQSIATHEIGHLLGLDHSDPCTDNAPTMMTEGYWISDFKSTAESPTLGIRSLAQGDMDGLNYLYGATLRVPEIFSNIEEAISFAQSGQTIVVSSGDQYINGNITIGAGVTIKVAPNIQLVVNGTLNVQGSSSDTVRFMLNGTSGNWLGIRFNNGSSGSINYAKIQKSTWGIFFNNLGNNNISVSNSRIQDNSSYGIWFANSSLMTIQRNHIINNGSYGIYCDNYSSPYIYYNMIRKHSIAGLYCNYYSSPYASTSGGAGNNVIKDNSGYGLYANYNSNPHFGDGTSYAYNSIYLNTSDEVKATNGCNVWVQNDYWGSGFSFNADQTSTIHHEYQLATDPNQGRTLSVDPGDNKTNTARVNLNVGSNGLSLKNKVETVSDSSDELSQWLDVFKKERNTLNGRYALIKIEECYSKAEKNGFEEFVNAEIFSRKGVKDELTVMGIELINHSLMSKGDYNAVIKNLEKIKNELLLNESIEKNTLYALGSIYLNSINDKTHASKYFEELKQKFPNDLLVYNSELLLGNQPDPKLFKEAGTDETQSKNEVPANLELSGNYPNPFNPTTIINYSLPEDGNVQIKVFDVLGREVATLINGFNSSGKHNVAWDGTNFASGIYFYSITFKDQTLYKKMLLMK